MDYGYIYFKDSGTIQIDREWMGKDSHLLMIARTMIRQSDVDQVDLYRIGQDEPAYRVIKFRDEIKTWIDGKLVNREAV